MAESGVYVYAVTSRPCLGPLAGVSGAPVRVVEQGDLAAVASTVPLAEYGEAALRENLEDLVWLEETARAHHAVVRAVAPLAPTAPVRLVTVFQDDERVRGLLHERRAEIEQVLSRVAGRWEWGVKAYTPGAPGASGAPEVSAPVDRPVNDGSGTAHLSGTAYLRKLGERRRAVEDAARAVSEWAEDAHARLSARAVAGRRYPPQDPRLSERQGVMVLNAAYLVEQADGPDFAATAEGLGERVEVTGPWPAYSFAELGVRA